MPRSVIRYFSASDAPSLEKKLDQFASDNPKWEIVSASHQLVPGLILRLLRLSGIYQSREQRHHP